MLAGFVLWGLLSIIGSGALAGVVTLPPQLQPGDQYRLVFVTNGTRNASSQDIEVYNTFVQNQALLSAELAGLGINWHVIGSTLSVNAKDNTGTFAGVPIYNLNAQLVASGDLDLWDGALGNPINIDIYGNVLDGRVFTGTGTDGTGIENRQLGGPNSFQVQYGLLRQYWRKLDKFRRLARSRRRHSPLLLWHFRCADRRSGTGTRFLYPVVFGTGRFHWM